MTRRNVSDCWKGVYKETLGFDVILQVVKEILSEEVEEEETGSIGMDMVRLLLSEVEGEIETEISDLRFS